MKLFGGISLVFNQAVQSKCVQESAAEWAVLPPLEPSLCLSEIRHKKETKVIYPQHILRKNYLEHTNLDRFFAFLGEYLHLGRQNKGTLFGMFAYWYFPKILLV